MVKTGKTERGGGWQVTGETRRNEKRPTSMYSIIQFTVAYDGV